MANLDEINKIQEQFKNKFEKISISSSIHFQIILFNNNGQNGEYSKWIKKDNEYFVYY